MSTENIVAGFGESFRIAVVGRRSCCRRSLRVAVSFLSVVVHYGPLWRGLFFVVPRAARCVEPLSHVLLPTPDERESARQYLFVYSVYGLHRVLNACSSSIPSSVGVVTLFVVFSLEVPCWLTAHFGQRCFTMSVLGSTVSASF